MNQVGNLKWKVIQAILALGIVGLIFARMPRTPKPEPAPVSHKTLPPPEVQPEFAPQKGNVAAKDVGGSIESITSAYGPGFNGNLLIDGSRDPAWEPSAATFPQEIVLSFFNREPARIRSVVITSPASVSAPKEIEVWVSVSGPDDGFQKVAEETIPAFIGDHTIGFVPVEARFLKLKVLSAQEAGLKISEFQAIEADRAPDYLPLAVRNPDMATWKTSPRHAAQLGIEWLQAAATAWQGSHNCFGCHVQSQVAMGLSVAQKAKYVVSKPALDDLVNFIRNAQNDDGTFHGGDHVVATSFAGMALAYAAGPAGQTDPHLVRAADWLLQQQDKKGAIPADHNEPPIDQGTLMTTANATAAFEAAFQQVHDGRFKRAAEKSLAWIAASKPETTQDKVFLVMALSRFTAGPRRRLVEQTVAQLKQEQREDGGWGETAAMQGSNPFATGQVLYAFKQVGESVESAEFTRGVKFLLDNQKPSGSWPSMNSQSGRPSEFAPTMWAVIGLAGSFRDAKCAEVAQNGDRIVISLCDAVLFDFDHSELKPAAITVLGQVKTAILDQYRGSKISIEGHTDDRGTEAYNQALSERRADAVAQWLVGQGIDSSRVAPKGFGKRRPKNSNDNEEYRARNRRVEIALTTR